MRLCLVRRVAFFVSHFFNAFPFVCVTVLGFRTLILSALHMEVIILALAIYTYRESCVAIFIGFKS